MNEYISIKIWKHKELLMGANAGNADNNVEKN